ncbi:hypothetical protein NUW54_g12788 [Trametes sanguinea]|uniref:Uncharacterized protein n=1 Tax=Trametes sanguinea TaxID=158606 RepID=A0ACC1MVG0_9APHY|nr:hypothetical protein NUW54_g12788 [Trametes sanguinea]
MITARFRGPENILSANVRTRQRIARPESQRLADRCRHRKRASTNAARESPRACGQVHRFLTGRSSLLAVVALPEFGRKTGNTDDQRRRDTKMVLQSLPESAEDIDRTAEGGCALYDLAFDWVAD